MDASSINTPKQNKKALLTRKQNYLQKIEETIALQILGLTHFEIAEFLSISASTVNERLIEGRRLYGKDYEKRGINKQAGALKSLECRGIGLADIQCIKKQRTKHRLQNDQKREVQSKNAVEAIVLQEAGLNEHEIASILEYSVGGVRKLKHIARKASISIEDRIFARTCLHRRGITEDYICNLIETRQKEAHNKQREVLDEAAVLKLEGLTKPEMAKVLGLSLPGIRERLRKARECYDDDLNKLPTQQRNRALARLSIKWASQPRSEAECEQIEEFLLKSKNVSVDLLTKQFGILLRHAIEEAGYDLRYPSVHNSIATLIAYGHTPVRDIDIDPLLVKAWLDGEMLPSREAWEGVRHWLRETETIPDYYRRTMDAIFTAARAKTRDLPEPAKFECEAQQTAKLRIKQSLKLKQKDLGELLARHDFRGGKALNPENIHVYINGVYRMKYPEYNAIDSLTQEIGKTFNTSLTTLHQYQLHNRFQQEWQKANTLGPMLRAVRRAYDVSQVEIAEYLNLDNSMVTYWEKETVPPNSYYAYCPSEDQLKELIDYLVKYEQHIADHYGAETFPILSPKIIDALYEAQKQTKSDRINHPTASECTVYDRRLISTVFVLDKIGCKLSDICELTGLSRKQVPTARQKVLNQPPSEEEIISSSQRLILQTDDSATISKLRTLVKIHTTPESHSLGRRQFPTTQLGAVERNVPKETKQKSSGRAA